MKISPLTTALNANYNPYVGDMPQNGKLVTTLNMVSYTGNFTNELQMTLPNTQARTLKRLEKTLQH